MNGRLQAVGALSVLCVVLLLLFLPMKDKTLDCGSVLLKADLTLEGAAAQSSKAPEYAAYRKRTCDSKYETRIVVASAVGAIGLLLVLGGGWAMSSRGSTGGGSVAAE